MRAVRYSRPLLHSLSKTKPLIHNHPTQTTNLYVALHNIKNPLRYSSTLQADLTYNESHLLCCLKNGKLHHARHLLDEMSKRGNQSSVVKWTSTLSRFAKRGLVDEARVVFDMMVERNVVSYNAMLSGYVKSGRISEAWRLFEEMEEKNVVSWTTMLNGLMGCGRVEEGRRLFEGMPERNVVSWNCMVGGLVRNGDLVGARSVFDGMPVRDLVSWNGMIDGYVESGDMEEARVLFDQMEEKNVVTWTTLVSGYCRVGQVENGYEFFRVMPEKNVVSWTAMIGGFSWNGFYEEAILMFLEMIRASDVNPNEESFVSLAYACAGIGLSRLGKQLHTHLIINGWEYHNYGRLLDGLIYMYSRFGLVEYAQCIFMKNSRNWSTQSCNAMINGYIQRGQLQRAEYIFETMPVRDTISWTSMITGYLDTGQVHKARELFYKMPVRDPVAWTAMISGYVQNELFSEAMHIFVEMLAQGVTPLQYAYSTLLGAAGATANLDQGRQLHCLLFKTETTFDLILNNSLISMYSKCGQVDNACRVFSNMTCRDLISWNSMIMGYSLHGLAHEALSLFSIMVDSMVKPNSVTLLGILSACSHAGLINEGCELYRVMNEIYGVQPNVEHHVCIINLLGRAGKLNEAEQFVLNLSPVGVAVWGALLGVCGFSEESANVACRTSQRLLELDPKNGPAYIALCNMYAAVGQYGQEGILRTEMRLKGMRKTPGCSWTSDRTIVQMFLSGDRSQFHGNEASFEIPDC